MMDDDFDKLTPDFLALARRIFDAGKEAGRKEERERLLSLLQSSSEQPQLPAATRPQLRLPGARSSRRVAHGEISYPVLRIVRELSLQLPEGVGAFDVLGYFNEQGTPINELQIRAAMKHLHVTGRIRRAAVGRYLPVEASESPSSGEVPDADPSGYSLAAE
jgi:hypothetical protein